MVRPTKPKEMKPKTDVSSEPSPGADGNKMLIINGVTTLLICLVFIAANYFIQDKLLSAKLSVLQTHDEDLTEEHVGEQVERGIILDLGEFILNLSDIKLRRYLKVNVAIELTKAAHDPNFGLSSTGGHGGGGSHGAPAPPDPMEIIEKEMSLYKPAIRDSIISILSSKTSEELSSVAGKEIAKEQIKEAVDAIFAGEREVIRVSFGNFIIQ